MRLKDLTAGADKHGSLIYVVIGCFLTRLLDFCSQCCLLGVTFSTDLVPDIGGLIIKAIVFSDFCVFPHKCVDNLSHDWYINSLRFNRGGGVDGRELVDLCLGEATDGIIRIVESGSNGRWNGGSRLRGQASLEVIAQGLASNQGAESYPLSADE